MNRQAPAQAYRYTVEDNQPEPFSGYWTDMGQDHRRIRRFAVQIPCTFGEEEDRREGTILNLSDQGCAMMAELVPPVSSYLPLRIALPDGTTAIEIELAGVRWVFGHRCGLEFISLSPETLTELRSFVLVLENTP